MSYQRMLMMANATSSLPWRGDCFAYYCPKVGQWQNNTLPDLSGNGYHMTRQRGTVTQVGDVLNLGNGTRIAYIGDTGEWTNFTIIAHRQIRSGQFGLLVNNSSESIIAMDLSNTGVQRQKNLGEFTIIRFAPNGWGTMTNDDYCGTPIAAGTLTAGPIAIGIGGGNNNPTWTGVKTLIIYKRTLTMGERSFVMRWCVNHIF